MRYLTLSRVLKGLLVLGFGLAVMSQSVEAKTRPIVVTNSVDRGNHVVVNAGSKWKSKSVTVEVGVQSKKKTWKWSRVGMARTDRRGVTQMCSARTIAKGNQLRLRSGKSIVATIKIRQNVTLSGCGYVAPTVPQSTVVPTGTSPVPAATPDTTPTQSVHTTTPPTTTPPTTTSPTTTPPTTTPPTTAPPTTTSTTLAPFTPAPNALALSAASDTGDSSSDGITKETDLVIEGSAAANSTIQVLVNGIPSGSTCITNSSSMFACTLGTVAEGNHVITAIATLNSVESLSSSDYNIVVDRTAPTATIVAAADTANGGVKTEFVITVSENTTTLTNDSITVACNRWRPGGFCNKEDFTGSGSSYKVKGSLVWENENIPMSITLRLNTDAYFDIAGNAHSFSVSDAVGYDYMGPQATLTLQLQTFTLTFNEVPVDFSVSNMQLMSFNYEDFKHFDSGNNAVDNFAPFGTSGRVWTFTLQQNIIDSRFPTTYPDVRSWWYKIRVAPVFDTDNNQQDYQEFYIP